MNSTETDRLVDNYLRRLEVAAAHWQRSRRTELVAEIREHIETALRQEEAAGEAAVRNVLERLGEPEEIVDAAEPPGRAAPPVRGRALEITALLALLVPFIGWLVGIVLVLVSEAWARRDKAIGIALVLLPIALPLLVVTVESGSAGDIQPVPTGDPGPADLPDAGSDSGPGGVEFFALFMLAGLPAALFLGWRLRRHPTTSAGS
jgi:hypothetical protein